MEALTTPLVSVEWLAQNLNHPDLVIIDASLPKIGVKDAPKETLKIKNAWVIDLDRTFSDTTHPLPHTMLHPDDFTREARKIGVSNDSLIVVYDNLGIYSSPRVWWMFRAMGHDRVSVLDGGLPAWKQAGLPCEPVDSPAVVKEGNFTARYRPELIRDAKDVLAALEDQHYQVVDARSEGRFLGKTPEPREGLRSGHMPNALNLPFDKVLNQTHLQEKPELERIYQNLADPNQELIFSCGSGITACILALSATVAGYQKISVYDGSWSEWGAREELPVVK